MRDPIDISIDVDDSQQPQAFEDARELFYPEELARAVGKIREHVEKATKPNTVSRVQRQRLVRVAPEPVHSFAPITVFGTRGAGKSSFMRTIQHQLQTPDDGKVAVLDILEPNRIETQEIPLVTVVAAILRHVNVHRSYSNQSAELAAQLQALDKCYGDLSRGFGVLVRGPALAARDRAESEATFARRVLDGSDSGLALRERFQRFVQAAASFCGAKAFLLCIDDVDVAHQRYSDVLETVRKYLDIPELIVVIAADEELLDVHLTACAHEWLGELVDSDVRAIALGKKAAERNVRRHRTQAYLLKEQYLTKLLPPEYRIYLRPLAIQIREESAEVKLRRGPYPQGGDSAKEYFLRDCLKPLAELLGGDWKLAAEYLPSKNRSLMRMTPLLLDWRQREPEMQDGSVASGSKKRDLLGELVRMSGRAFAAAGVRGWTLRRLQEGKGDGALMRWVIHHAVDTPRSFNLEADSSPDGDERRLVPALLYACWVDGCRNQRRSDAFLSYGLRVVLPAYVVERSRSRQRVADSLDYRLKHGANQTCAATVAQLIAWQKECGPRFASTPGDAEGGPIFGQIDVASSRLYDTDDGKRKNFFLGLARIADLCASWSRFLAEPAPVDAQREADWNKRVEQFATFSKTDPASWDTWLRANQELEEPLPARAIGELFVFLCEQYRGNTIEKTDKALVHAFLYALGTQELTWRRIAEGRSAMPERLAGEYSPVTKSDLGELFNRVKEIRAPSYLEVWRRCPAFVNGERLEEPPATGDIDAPIITG